MVLPRFTSPFRGMRSRFAKHLSCPFGTPRTFQHVCRTSLARDAPVWLALDFGIALIAAQARTWLPIALAKCSTLSYLSCINKHLETVSSNVRCLTHRHETIHINNLYRSGGCRSDDCHPPHTPHARGLCIRIHVHTGHKETCGVYWHMASLGKKSPACHPAWSYSTIALGDQVFCP